MAVPKLIRETDIIHRFSDVVEEPCTMLPPIEGFSNIPLVSLEEAVKPLVSIVCDVIAKASLAKEGAKNPSDDLSVDESASIALYTMEWEPYTSSLYYILNSALRNADRHHLKPWLFYLKIILRALSRLPSIRMTIYRSLKLNKQLDFEKYQEGQHVIWWGFSSCTTNKRISEKEHFLTTSGTRTLFIIECSEGKDIGSHSYNKNDQEVLLLPAAQFQVIRCEHRQDDVHKIYMKQVEPKSVLLELVFSPSLSQTPQQSPASTRGQRMNLESMQQFFRDSFDQIFKD